MKKLKCLSVILICFLVATLNTKAATGDGICYGKEVNTNNFGYCKIDPIYITASSMPHHNIGFTNGVKPGVYEKDFDYTAGNKYSGIIGGKEETIFCLDYNRHEPDPGLAYIYGRSLDISKGYDQMMAKAYNNYIEESLKLVNSGMTKEAAFDRYLQAANILMRLLTIKSGNSLFDYDWVDKPELHYPGYKVLTKKYKNGVLQLGGQKPVMVRDDYTNTNLGVFKLFDFSRNNPGDFDRLQKWYCSSMLAYDAGKYGSLFSASEINYCKSLQKSAKNPIIDSKPALTFKVNVKVDASKITMQQNGNNFTKNVPFVISGLSGFRKASYKSSNPEVKITSVECENKDLTCRLENPAILNTNIVPIGTGDTHTIKVIVEGDQSKFLKETSTNVTVKFEQTHILESTNLAIIRHALSNADHIRQRMVVLMPGTPRMEYVKMPLTFPSICKAEIIGKSQIYKYGDKELGELSYLQTGCCNVNYTFLTNQAAIDYYLENCNNGDLIKLVSSCLTDDSKNCLTDDNKTNANRKATHSYIYQNSIDKIMKQINAAEEMHYNGSYNINNLNNILNGYKNNIDTGYMKGVSSANNYCQMYTSERQDILFPGMVDATSGKFFIFDKSQQPTVEGSISGNFHTDVRRWKKDYISAINKEKAAYTAWQEELSVEDSVFVTTKHNQYKNAKTSRMNLEKYKNECETKSNVVNNWKYQLSPDLTFYYKQKVASPLGGSEDLIESIPMKISYESDGKYWTNATKQHPNKIANSVKGTRSEESHSFSYGSGANYVNETFAFDTTQDYSVGYEQTLFYKPLKHYYSIVPSGKYIVENSSVDYSSALDIGYIFNIDITNYRGEYETWFEIENIGHLMQETTTVPKQKSNIQKSMEKFLLENQGKYPSYDDMSNTSVFANKCFYCNKEILYKQSCENCEDPTFEPRYYYRNVSINNMNPNKKTNTNWTTSKGISAQQDIERKGEDIYNDLSKEHLEYSFTLSPTDMQTIKNENKNKSLDDFNLKCTAGKECKSSFLEEWARSSEEADLLNATRNEKWKYFIPNPNTGKGEWKKGTINSLFKNGYPKETEGYSNWP